jgi:galactokinase/mevalonate kinase-like predicted kinase
LRLEPASDRDRVSRRLVVTAPARANLIGNPSDLYGGAVLGCAVPCRARVQLRSADRLALETAGARQIVASRDDLRLQGDRFDVARAALAAQPELPEAQITYDSEIPFGSGLAGSTALLAALLRALAAWRGEAPSPYELAERSRQTERELLGVACGWVDHYLCSFGGLRYVDLRAKDADKAVAGEPFATVEDLAPHVPKLPFVLAFTGVSHHSGSVHAPIRARWERGETEVVRAYERVATIAREGKTALLRAEWPRLGALMNENHAIQRGLGGSGESNERLVAAALGAGALGAKLAGAGGGGTIVALWPRADAASLEAALRAAGATALYRPQPVRGVAIESDA